MVVRVLGSAYWQSLFPSKLHSFQQSLVSCSKDGPMTIASLFRSLNAAYAPADGAPQRQARPSLPLGNKKDPLTSYAIPGGKSTVPEPHQTRQDRSSQNIGDHFIKLFAVQLQKHSCIKGSRIWRPSPSQVTASSFAGDFACSCCPIDN